MRPPPDGAWTGGERLTRGEPRLRRFSSGERWVHRSVALLIGVLLLTAAILYLAPLSQLVGRRHLVARRPMECLPSRPGTLSLQ